MTRRMPSSVNRMARLYRHVSSVCNYPSRSVVRSGASTCFEGPGGTYRVFVPEVITSDSKQPVIYCDKSQVVFADDHQVASARGVGEDCP